MADHGNARIQVLDRNLAPQAVFDWIGKPWAICITPGTPQYLYVSTNEEHDPETNSEREAEIYKLELDGTIVGRLRNVTDSRTIMRTIHSLDCHNQNEVYAAAPPLTYLIHVLR